MVHLSVLGVTRNSVDLKRSPMPQLPRGQFSLNNCSKRLQTRSTRKTGEHLVYLEVF